MKKTYLAPGAELVVFRPAEALADLTWQDLLQNQHGEGTGAEKASGDIYIKL